MKFLREKAEYARRRNSFHTLKYSHRMSQTIRIKAAEIIHFHISDSSLWFNSINIPSIEWPTLQGIRGVLICSQ